jgi:hypothetical protein
MMVSGAFQEAVQEQRDVALRQLSAAHASGDEVARMDALGRLADLDELASRALGQSLPGVS